MEMSYLDPHVPRRIDGWAQSRPRSAHADRHLRRSRPSAAALPDRGGRLPRERAVLPGEVDRAGDPRRPGPRLLDRQHQPATRGWTRRCRCPSRGAARRSTRATSRTRSCRTSATPAAIRAVRIATAGASFGAFHAANSLCRRPDLFDGADRDERLLRPRARLPEGLQRRQLLLQQPGVVPQGAVGRAAATCCSTACRIVIVSGQGAYESPRRRRRSPTSSARGHPAHARPLGPRREPRLAVVAADAAALPVAGVLTNHPWRPPYR